MRFALLLTLMAGSILAVSPQPVRRKEPVKQAEHIVAFIDLEKGVTDDSDSGDLGIGPPGYTGLINAALGTQSISWRYRGEHKPEGDLGWVLLKLTRGPYCTVQRPCFAWIAKGDSYPTRRQKINYMGIFRGPPPNQPGGAVEYIAGSPAKIHDDKDKRSKNEWETLMNNFATKKISGVPVPKPVFPAALDPPTVTLIDLSNGQPLPSQDVRWGLKTPLTRTLNKIFDLSGHSTITYHGTPKSLSVPVSFEFWGGDLRCTKMTPCYGWASNGPNPTRGDKAAFYMGIAQKTGEKWTYIITYSGVEDKEGHSQCMVTMEDFVNKFDAMLGAKALLEMTAKRS
ncbi:hypothetical protein BDP27DRAFT_1418430 [Rhodocollybia butyracea]|uniref:Uncharacterized protein n=1 Tax=Rhodocollybia butyracea TaxID=206335 RepID=A0A9P5PZK3_9AGAR|nr:hypothetical protein BDP27DRAFT_1418430 [Rhodocollybia butyracea]